MMQSAQDRLKLAAAGAMLLGLAAPTLAQEDAIEAAEDKISGTVGVDLATHFVSYGVDVWDAGNDWDDPSVFVWGELAWDLEPVTLTAGVWSDNNNNGSDPLAGPIQEIDVYVGAAVALGDFTVGATYQEWYYGAEETVLDLSLGYDDTGLISEDFAFNPSIVYHNRLSGDGIEEGAVLVAGVEPSFTIVESETYPLTLSIPVAAAFAVPAINGDDEFYSDEEDAFEWAYASVGATLGFPLAFIPAEYGEWAAAANTTYYFTNEDLTANPRDNFLTGMLSLSVGF